MCAWATSYSASNNINYNYPPIMNDSRIWSGWQPEATINEKIQKQEGIQSNFKYRQYLQQHGLQIMNYNNSEALYTLGLDVHVKTDTTPSDNVPFHFKGVFDTGKPGFGYLGSDLKNPYLSREQLNARMISPSIKPENFTNNKK